MGPAPATKESFGGVTKQVVWGVLTLVMGTGGYFSVSLRESLGIRS